MPSQSCNLTNSNGCDSTAVLNLTIAVCGCTDSLATNYNPLAILDDSSCCYINITQNDTIICFGDSISLVANVGTIVNFQQACTLNELPPNLHNGLVAYYPFCGNADDYSGNNNHGTVYGATLTHDVNGNDSSAYYLTLPILIRIVPVGIWGTQKSPIGG